MALREVLAQFRVRADTKQLDKANKKVNAGVQGLKNLAATAGLAFGARAISGFIRKEIELGDSLGKTSKQLGISVENLQKYQFAADRSGVEANAFNQSIVRLQRGMFDAANGSKTVQDAFSKLGLSVKDSNGELKSAERFLPEMAEGLRGLENSTERVAIANTLMGRSGAKLLPFFDEGAEGIEKLFARFDELGGGMSKEFTDNAEVALDALTDFDLASQGLRTSITVGLLPKITDMVNIFANLIGRIRKSELAMQLIKGALTGLGVALTVFAASWLAAFAPAILTVAVIAAGFAAIMLIVDDLTAMFEGRKSVVAEFIDELLGAGTARLVVDFLKERWQAFMLVLQDTPMLLSEVWDNAQEGLTDFGKWVGSLFDDWKQLLNLLGEVGDWFDLFDPLIEDARNSLGGFLGSLGLDGLADSVSIGARNDITNRRGRLVPPPSAGRLPSNTTNNIAGNTVVVPGAGNPQNVARAVGDELDRRQRAAMAAVRRRRPA